MLNADKMRSTILRNPMGYSKRKRRTGTAVVFRATRVPNTSMLTMDVLVP